MNYFLDRLGDFINIFRYQGYDNKHHFHHCTQLVGGCKFPAFSSSSSSSSTTTRRPVADGEDYEDSDENMIEVTTIQSVRLKSVLSKQSDLDVNDSSNSSLSRSTKIIISKAF